MIYIKLTKIHYYLAMVFLISLSICSKLPAVQNRKELANSAIPRLEKVLQENIASFWYNKSLDRVNGGYTINFGPKGEPKGPGTKMIVTGPDDVALRPAGESRL